MSKLSESRQMLEKAAKLTQSTQERKVIERYLEQIGDVRIPASDEVVQKSQNK